jgi:hypothetical protein
MKPACDMIAVIGAVAVVGPVELAESDTTYRYLVIQEQGGRLRDFTMVRAVPELSELIELHAIGMFVLADTAAECRLWCVERADGPKAVDFAAIRNYFAPILDVPKWP